MDDGMKRDLVELLDAVRDSMATLTEEVVALLRRVDALEAKAEKPPEAPK